MCALELATFWRENLLAVVILLRVLARIGSFSNDDGDGKEDVETAIGLLSKTTTLHVHHAFFVHFLTVLARLRRENA